MLNRIIFEDHCHKSLHWSLQCSSHSTVSWLYKILHTLQLCKCVEHPFTATIHISSAHTTSWKCFVLKHQQDSALQELNHHMARGKESSMKKQRGPALTWMHGVLKREHGEDARMVGIPGNTYLKRMRTPLNQEICLQQHPLPIWQIPSSDLPASKSVSTFICTNLTGSCPNVIMWPTTSSLKEAHSMLKTSQVHTVVPDFWCPFQIMLQQCITKYSPGQNSRMRKLWGLLLVIRDNETVLSKNNWPPYHVKKPKQDAS